MPNSKIDKLVVFTHRTRGGAAIFPCGCHNSRLMMTTAQFGSRGNKHRCLPLGEWMTDLDLPISLPLPAPSFRIGTVKFLFNLRRME